MKVNYRDELIDDISELLGIKLPGSYSSFLKQKGSTIVNGLPILGMPVSFDLDSVWGATEFLRSQRPDLPNQFIAIRFIDAIAYCLDLRQGSSSDAPVVEVDLESEAAPRLVSDTFTEFLHKEEHVIDELCRSLELEIPESYTEYLQSHGRGEINGLPILGVPLNSSLSSALGATQHLRTQRSDLPPKFVVIRLLDSRALCLDIENGTSKDAPLVEIDLESERNVRRVHDSFRDYIIQAKKTESWIGGALRRISFHLRENRKRNKDFDHRSGGSFNRPHEWRVIRSCVHDRVVGLTAIKYNDEFDGTDIDVFIATDHPEYVPGHGIRGLLLLILTDTYKNGGTLELRFSRYDKQIRGRKSDRIPPEVSILAQAYDVALRDEEKAIINHDESVKLFAFLVGLSQESIKRAQSFESEGRLTLQGVSFLIGTRIWTANEVEWILHHCPRPEGVLFGSDLPESRLFYQESLSFGCSALATTKLINKLQIGEYTEEHESTVIVHEKIWLINPTKSCELDWLMNGEILAFRPGEGLEVLPRCREGVPEEESRIMADVEFLAEKNPHSRSTHRGILYIQEFKYLTGIASISRKVLDQYGIFLIMAPYSFRELSEEVDRRMSRARGFRK